MSSLPERPAQRQNDEPLYNIGVVTRMTGISMATLRAWERRYTFPESSRTRGGHRLYTENDILRLRWVKARIEEGMQTAQAIHALLAQEQRGSLVSQTVPPGMDPGPSSANATLSVLKDKLIETLIAQRLEQADHILAGAIAYTTPEDLILKVITPTLAEIGEAWLEKRIDIPGEHFASNYLRQRVLMWMLSSPPPQAMPPVVLACAPGEWHEGSLLVLGALLRRRRIPVAYLGQSVPLDDLRTFLDEMRPGLVVLVAMLEETAAQLADWPDRLPESAAAGKPIISFGGRAFVNHPELKQQTPGLYLGDTLEEGLAKIEEYNRSGV